MTKVLPDAKKEADALVLISQAHMISWHTGTERMREFCNVLFFSHTHLCVIAVAEAGIHARDAHAWLQDQ